MMTKLFFISGNNSKKLTLLFFVPVLLLTLSCKNSEVKEEEIETKKELILELHDNLMLDLPEIKRIKSAILLQVKDSTLAINSAQLFEVAITNLDKADKAMWDWMHQFNISYEGKGDSLTLAYFDEQYMTLLDVKTNMDSAITVGESTISD